MADMNEIVRELSVKHGIAIGRDDPVMMLATLQAIMLRDLQTAQNEALGEFNSRLELMMSNWTSESKHKAERIVNGALEAATRSVEQQQQVLAASLEKVFNEKNTMLRETLAATTANQQAGIRGLYWVAGGALAMSVLALLAAVLF
jgi:hypothetical protein